VRIIDECSLDGKSAATVFVNPHSDAARLERFLSGGRKNVLFGSLKPDLASAVGLRLRRGWRWESQDGCAMSDSSRSYDESPLVIAYSDDHELARACPLRRRPLCRFDFADEWNNLGFGRIGVYGDAWSLGPAADLNGATPLAWVETRDGADRSCCAALFETADAAVLWYNRPVGPVDSLEWRIIEAFLGDYRPDDLVCLPYLGEVPAGFSGAVTMRLDCDEAVASARQLFELYASLGVPFSLALKTGLELDRDDRQLLHDVFAEGGAVVSHSHQHLPDWGGSYETARREAVISRNWLRDNLPQAEPVRYAVSPFHRNPQYAVRALADAGYSGFVGGIIDQSPEFLLGRAGEAPLVEPRIISHSQQCMLHGDCYHRAGSSMEVYCQSFANHARARSIFGYLDHPFSPRYQYGWNSEKERLGAHEYLLRHCLSQPGLWLADLGTCMDFVKKRSDAFVHLNRHDEPVVECAAADSLPPLELCWKGESRVA
jgi:hypothetical protein